MPKKRQPSKKSSKSKKPPAAAEKEVKKEGTTKKKPTHSYSTYIGRLKGQFGAKVRLNCGVLQQMDRMAQVFARTLSSSAREVCISNKKKTVTDSEVQLAINLYFPENLANETVQEIEKAIKKSVRAHNKKHDAPVRREVLAGLVFPVSLTEKFLREFDASKLNVGKNAPIALTAALEYVVRKVLDVSVTMSKENKKATVYPRHMFLAISNDEDLSVLIRNFNLEFMGVGVIPHIRPRLIADKAKKNTQAARRRKSRARDSNKKSHKFLPGTVALREIRKYQKSGELLLQKLPFDRMVREIARNLSEGDIHFGNGTLASIQYFIEQKVVGLLNTSVGLALHANREGVKDKDVQMAWKLTYSWVPQTATEAALDDSGNNDGEDKKPKGTNGMVRLGRRGGAKRIGKDAFPIIRQFIHSLVSIILTRTIEFLKYRRVITVGLGDLENSVSTFGINLAILRPPAKHRSVKKAVTAEA